MKLLLPQLVLIIAKQPAKHINVSLNLHTILLKFKPGKIWDKNLGPKVLPMCDQMDGVDSCGTSYAVRSGFLARSIQ